MTVHIYLVCFQSIYTPPPCMQVLWESMYAIYFNGPVKFASADPDFVQEIGSCSDGACQGAYVTF